MRKAYLNILLDVSVDSAPTVVEVEICPTPGHRRSGDRLSRFWATVDECQATTLALAEKCLLGRLELAAGTGGIDPFGRLLEMYQEHHVWDPVLSDALGG